MVYPPESRSLKNTERNLLPSHLTGVLCRPQCPSAGALPNGTLSLYKLLLYKIGHFHTL